MIIKFSLDDFQIFSSKNSLSLEFERSSPHPTFQGYIFKGNISDILGKIYPKMSSLNPRTKMITVLKDVDQDAAEEVLRTGFNDFRIFNNIVLILRGTQEIRVCAYDPFHGVHEKDHVHLFCLNINLDNFEEAMPDIKSFLEIRVNNLHNYNMKVMTFKSLNTQEFPDPSRFSVSTEQWQI